MASITRNKRAGGWLTLGQRLAVLAFWLLVWQAAAAAVHQELLIPAPLSVARTLGTLAATPVFWQTTLRTLLRIFAGFVIGAAAGSGLAVLTSASPAADLLLSPVIRMVRATPVVSFIILILLWLQTDIVPAFIAVMMVIPVLWESVGRGIRETDPELLEMARVFRFGKLKILREVYIPSILPYFAAGCLTALGLAWKSGVAAEVLCVPRRAIGTQVYYSKVYLETPSLFAWTLVIIVLSMLLEWLLSALLRRLGRSGAGRRVKAGWN